MLSIFFYGFAVLLISSALLVVFLNNTIYSIFSLLAVLLFMACLWMMLSAEFLALSLILIYVGAVIVLFLCALMLLDFSLPKTKPKAGVMISCATLGLILILGITYFIESQHFGSLDLNRQAINNTQAIGNILYTKYWLALLTTGMVLLIAVVGAVKILGEEANA